MQQAKLGDSITVDYEGVLDNGEIFESTQTTGELEFTLGTASVMKGLEDGMVGAAIGETRDIVISPENAFGLREKNLIQELDRAVFGEKSNELQTGMILHLTLPKDDKEQQIPATIIELSDDKVTVDYNHPLAGHSLTYKVTLKAIKAGKSPVVHVPDGDVANFKG